MILPVLDDLTLLAATIYMEARGEPFEGKVAVGWVILNRDARSAEDGLADVVLAPFQFSAWNSDSRARARLQAAMQGQAPDWRDSLRAAAGVLFGFLPDPTHGATFYLNVEETKRMRGGTLPSWYDPARVTARIGLHEFLRA